MLPRRYVIFRHIATIICNVLGICEALGNIAPVCDKPYIKTIVQQDGSVG